MQGWLPRAVVMAPAASLPPAAGIHACCMCHRVAPAVVAMHAILWEYNIIAISKCVLVLFTWWRDIVTSLVFSVKEMFATMIVCSMGGGGSNRFGMIVCSMTSSQQFGGSWHVTLGCICSCHSLLVLLSSLSSITMAHSATLQTYLRQ